MKTCEENKLIPKFLKFRIPTIGCFNKYAVEMFQTKLLKTELRNAKNLLDKKKKETEDCLIQLRPKIPAKLIPTVLLHTRIAWSTEREKLQTKHQNKLNNLSIDQDRPIANRNEYAINILHGKEQLPEYVKTTLAKGTKHPILNKFDKKPAAAAYQDIK